MQDTRTFIDRNILMLSLFALFYFSFLLLNSTYLRMESVAMGFIQELITIPIMIGQAVLLVLAWKRFKQSDYIVRSRTFAAMVILVISNLFVMISFIYT